MEYLQKILFDLYGYARRKFFSFPGLIASVFISLILFILIARIFLDIKSFKGTYLSFLTDINFYAISWFIITFLILILWLIKRAVPKTKGKKIGILLGPTHTDKIRTELNDLLEKLQRDIQTKDLAKIISIKKLTSNHKVGEHTQNIQLLNKANARVLICGIFEEFTVGGKKATGFSHLTISAKSLPVKPQQVPNLLNDAIAGRQLIWTSENTIHKNVVANNLSEIARYIVGLSLITDLRFYNSKVILGPLLLEVKQKYNQRRLPIEIRRFIDTIQNAYVISLVREINQKYNDALLKEEIFKLDHTTISDWEKQIHEAIIIDDKNADALIILAVIKFLLGDIEKAKESIRKARLSVSLQDQCICDISEAFLLCYEGDLKGSKKLYKKIIKSKYTPHYLIMRNVLIFLDQAILSYPQKPQIRFSYALLNDEFGDKDIASQEFENFIKNVQGDNSFNQWVREAQLRIQRIKSNRKEN